MKFALFVLAVLLVAQAAAPGCACPGCPKEPGYELLMIGELMALGPEIAGMCIADAVSSQVGKSAAEAYALEMDVRFARLGLGAIEYASAEDTAEVDVWDSIVGELADAAKGSLGAAETPEDFTRIVADLEKMLDAAFAYWELRDYDRKVFAVHSWILALNYLLAEEGADPEPVRVGLLKRWRALEEMQGASEEERAKLRFIRRRLEEAPLAGSKASARAREAAAALADDFRAWLNGSVCARLPEAIRGVESNFNRDNPEKVAKDFRALILLMGHLERLSDKEADAQLVTIAEALQSIAIVTHGGFLPDTLIDRVPADLAVARRFFAGERAAESEPAPAEKTVPENARSRSLRIWLFAGIAGVGVFAIVLSALLKPSGRNDPD